MIINLSISEQPSDESPNEVVEEKIETNFNEPPKKRPKVAAAQKPKATGSVKSNETQGGFSPDQHMSFDDILQKTGG